MTKEAIFFVYQLRVDGSELPFYVGKGKGNRPADHFQSCQLKRKTHKNNTIKKAIFENKQILIEYIETELYETDSFIFEQFYISAYGRIDTKTGCLTNTTYGGEGVSGYIHTKEQRENMVKERLARREEISKTTTLRQWDKNSHIWINAQQCYDTWVMLNKPNICVFKRKTRTILSLNKMIARFKNGWVPKECELWNLWSSCQQKEYDQLVFEINDDPVVRTCSEEARKKIGEANKKSGHLRTGERNHMYGKQLSKDMKEFISKRSSNSKWYTNGTDEYFVVDGKEPPDGTYLGRTPGKKRRSSVKNETI